MKYTPGLLAGQLSGKAGNTVASRNRNGSYFRTRTIPKLVRNAYTTAVRDNFTELSQGFRELTADQVRAWNSLGDQFVRRNSIGQSFRLTGLQAYKSVNQRLLSLGLGIVSDAPQFESAPPADGQGVGITNNGLIVATTVTAGATSATQTVGSTADVGAGDTFLDITGTFSAVVDHVVDATHVVLTTSVTTTTADSVEFHRPVVVSIIPAPDPTPANAYLQVFATAPLSPGVTRPSKSAFRLISTIPPATSTSYDATSDYLDKFGPIPGASNVFFRFVYVTDAGFASSAFERMAAHTVVP